MEDHVARGVRGHKFSVLIFGEPGAVSAWPALRKFRWPPAGLAGETAAQMQPVLLTGFESFGGESVNASALAISALAGTTITGRRVETMLLPVIFGESSRRLLAEIERVRPALVVCVGQAAGRAEISLERIAINLEEAAIPDNAGQAPSARPVRGDGPAAYWSTLPIPPLRDALRAADIAVGVSLSAGSYVCNHLFYELMHGLREQADLPAGFVHIPVTPAQAAVANRVPPMPSMPTERVVAALRLIIETSLGATGVDDDGYSRPKSA